MHPEVHPQTLGLDDGFVVRAHDGYSGRKWMSPLCCMHAQYRCPRHPAFLAAAPQVLPMPEACARRLSVPG